MYDHSMKNLTPIIQRREYFTCLIFIIEGDCQNFFHHKNFPMYGMMIFMSVAHTLARKGLVPVLQWTVFELKLLLAPPTTSLYY